MNITCLFGHDEEIISTETLIKNPFYGFTFIKCKRCGKRKIDQPYFKGMKKGKWVDNWTDNGGILPQKSMIDKRCPRCNKVMEKTTAFGGRYECEPDIDQIALISNEDFHLETIDAVKEDFVEV